MEELKMLLERDFILKEEDRELYYRIKDSYKQMKPFIVDKLGYDLIIRGDFIRLEKRPGQAESWMGIKKFEDKVEYVFFMLLIMFLEDKNKEDQFLLSHITDYIAANRIGDEIDWTQYRTRKSLIKVLQVALTQKLIKITDGAEEDFIQDAHKEVLFESTGLSRYLVRTFDRDVAMIKSYRDLEMENEDLLDQERGTIRKNRVYRKLLLSPIVYHKEGQDEDYAYIKNYRAIIEEDFRKYLGWTLQVHRNGVIVIPHEQDKVSYSFPNASTLSDIILQLNSFIRREVSTGKWVRDAADRINIHEHEFEALVEALIMQKSEGWSKEYREASKERLIADLLKEMQRFKLVSVKKDMIILLPLVGKIIGDYPSEFNGGKIDE